MLLLVQTTVEQKNISDIRRMWKKLIVAKLSGFMVFLSCPRLMPK